VPRDVGLVATEDAPIEASGATGFGASNEQG